MKNYAIKLNNGELWKHYQDGEVITWKDEFACCNAAKYFSGSTVVEVHVTIADVKPSPSMFYSLGGVLGRASKTRNGQLAFSLNELHKHLEELRADPSKVHEFFQLWVK